MPDIAAEHQALSVFIGDWHADGSSYDDGGEPTPWSSIHTGRWHSGEFFVVQDERASGPFDTLSLMGWDGDAGRYFCRSVENHGYARDYAMTLDGDTWTITGDLERATITIGDGGRTQTHAWERKLDDEWVPLCNRVATRID